MKLWILAALALSAQAASAAAITVPASDLAGQIREVALQSVQLASGPADILADAKGISVYTFDLDSVGQSNCKGGCLKEWPPLHVDATEELPAPYGKIVGNDGADQLTLNGLPLYYYDDDKAPGDVFGDYPKWHPVVVTH